MENSCDVSYTSKYQVMRSYDLKKYGHKRHECAETGPHDIVHICRCNISWTKEEAKNGEGGGLMDQWRPEKISLDDFLEMYKTRDVTAITTDQVTQAYVMWIDGETTGGADTFYTHPACDEAPVTEYMDFMIELHRLRFC